MVTGILKELKEYGVTAEELEGLENETDDFRELVGQPRLKICRLRKKKPPHW